MPKLKTIIFSFALFLSSSSLLYSFEYQFVTNVSEVGGQDLVYPIGVAFLENDNIIVCTDYGLFITNMNGDHIKTISTEINGGNFKARYLAQNLHNGNIVISASDYRVHVLDKNWEYLFSTEMFESQTSRERFETHAVGVAVDQRNGNIYVTTRTQIEVFDEFGNYINSITMPESEKAMLRPNGIGISPNGDIVVADTNNDRILIFSEDGELIKKIGDNTGTIAFPHGIAIDLEGNIFVANTARNNILVFDSKGNFINKFGRYGSVLDNKDDPQFADILRGPLGVAINAKGDVAVTSSTTWRILLYHKTLK